MAAGSLEKRDAMAKNFLPALAIIAAALFAYGPALNGTWLWDDNLLVYSNVRLHTFAGLGKIWFAAPTTDYWPLTWTLLWIEWHLWGDAPLGYHLASLALHLTSAFLLWRVLARLGLRRGWIGALLFAVHPLAVESVAWISEIKNTLSLPLFLLAFDAWLDADEGRPLAYPRSLAFFVLALLAKTSTIMLPFVLALYCWWKRGRVTRTEFTRLVHYAAIALVFGVATLHFQGRGHPMPPVEPGGFIERLTLAGTAIFFYLGQFLLPLHLLTIYPAWPLDPPAWLQLLALPALGLLLELLYFARKSSSRHVLFGLGFFLLTALPVLGLADMQWLQFSPVADHLVYLPMLGLVGLAAAALDLILEKIPARLQCPMLGLIALGLAGLAVASHHNARHYRDPIALWSHTLAFNLLAWPAWNGLGSALLDSGRAAEAIPPLQQAILLEPEFEQAHYNLANAFLALGKTSDAIGEYNIALLLNPDDAQAHYNAGNALMQASRLPEAIAQYEQALKLIPDSAEIHGNLGQAFMRSGIPASAIAQFARASELDPTSPIAAYNLGLAHLQLGQTALAISQFQYALRIDPHFVPAQQILDRFQPNATAPAHP
jgi:tetratricopeptide (TPR) repeat protein